MTDTKGPFSQQKSPSPFWQKPGFLIGSLIVVFLLAGLLLVTHYGESWDEPIYIDYANGSLAAFKGVSIYLPEEKGPFFGMLALIGSKGLQALISSWEFIDGWHFMSFLAFLMSIYFFFRLCRRLVDPAPALVATALFSTQPIIWGHAFINHQDIPFMAFFLASVTLGLEMVDFYCLKGYVTIDLKPFIHWVAGKWKATSARIRRLLIILIIVLLGYWFIYPLIQLGVSWLINQAYFASDTSLLGKLFSRFAQHAGEFTVEGYVQKAQTQISGIALWVWIGLSIVFELITCWFMGLWNWAANALQRSFAEWRSAPRRIRLMLISLLLLITTVGYLFITNQLSNYIWLAWIGEICLLILSINVALKIFPTTIGQVLSLILEPRVLIAACFMGFSSDIRTLGIASGILIGIYSIFKNGRKAFPIMLAYFAVGIVIIYLCWPYLWNSPLNRFMAALSMAANFPTTGPVIFAGQQIFANETPPFYLPTLFGLQFTETAIVAILVGAVLAGIYIWKRTSVRLDLLVLGCWFLGPFGAAILLHSTLYNNFRQFLFIVPPLFVLASLAIQVCWHYLKKQKKTALFALLGLALIVPGVYWDIKLHPFEYIYYNSLVGNVHGAFRSFSLDYWATSYMTDIEYLNDVAPQNSIVFVEEPYFIVEPYARPDLKIIGRPLPVNSIKNNYYAVFLSENHKDQTIFPHSQIIFQVTRDNAILSVVKIVQPGDPIGQ